MNTFLQHVWENKFRFLITFFVVFTLTYIIFMAVDFLPEPVEETNEAKDDASQDIVMTTDELSYTLDNIQTEEVVQEPGETVQVIEEEKAGLPVSISIAKIEKTIAVLNPSSRNIAELDTALLDGVVRHPDSATMTQEGNVFILGHSSYLPNVFNKNFQAFNGIQNLEWGDVIEVSTADTVYEYRVEKVYRAKAQDVTVPIANTGNMLTLATCNSFGSVDDRYIVEAKQISSRVI
jgi:LPXTG-site transpeptidase (sortase) family protein